MPWQMPGMRFIARLAGVAVAASLVTASASAAVAPPILAKQIPVSDTYFGTTVVDPYRWMETPNNPDLLAYLKANAERTRSALDVIPGRAALVKRLSGLAETIDSSSGVTRRGAYAFYEKTPPGANSARLYVRRGIGGAERILVNPDALSGPRQAISWFVPSDDGTRVAIGLASGGSENAVGSVLDVATGTMLPDRLERARFGVTSWSADGGAVYYAQQQKLAPGANPMLAYVNIKTYRHVLGTSQDQDVAVFGAGLSPLADIPPTSFALLQVSPESPYAAGLVINGVSRFATVYVAPKAAIGSPNVPWRKIIDASDLVINATLHGSMVYALTSKDAPRFKIVKFDPRTGTAAGATSVIAPSARVLDSIASASDALYVQSRENGLGRITRVSYADGSATDIPLPVEGTVSGLDAQYDRPGFLMRLESWTSSPRWYSYDPARNALADTKIDPPSTADYSNIESTEVNVKARDGAMIPLSIIHRRGMALDGNNPTLLNAYGSYGISEDPSFSAGRLAWFEQGGVLAVAHVRGGGEYGEEWHLGGKDANKINTINDFIDCAQFLIDDKITNPSKLGARGGSAGGITMGGAITRAPQLFAAVLDEVPVSDQLRIEFSANGPPNVPEFGTVTTEQGFKNLYATSAVHHVAKGTKYPAVMLTTGINDPRVDPWQAAKMAATLQAATAGPRPILVRVDYEGGHGGIGGSKNQAVETAADEYAFLLWQFGMPGFQPPG